LASIVRGLKRLKLKLVSCRRPRAEWVRTEPNRVRTGFPAMDKLEPIKRLAERATGVGFPSPDEALVRIVKRTPRKLKFRSDGYIPNSKRPLLIYRNAVRFTDGDPAALIEAIF
jgi:hypothetical protein